MKKKIKKAKVIQHKIPLSKSLGALMKDEDGFVSKETILKVGLSSVAALGIAGAVADIASGQYGYTHGNHLYNQGQNCITHTNVTSYSSY